MEATKIAIVLVLLLLVVSVIGVFSLEKATFKSVSSDSATFKQSVQIVRPLVTAQSVTIIHEGELNGGVNNEK